MVFSMFNWKGAGSSSSSSALEPYPPLSPAEKAKLESLVQCFDDWLQSLDDSERESLKQCLDDFIDLKQIWDDFKMVAYLGCIVGTSFTLLSLSFLVSLVLDQRETHATSSNVKPYHRRPKDTHHHRPKNRYDECQNNVFALHWSNATRFLTGIWTRQGDWENLPEEMLREIGKRMVSRLDIVTFRSVCKKWRSSLPSPIARFPLLLPPPPNCDPEFHNVPYAISELNIYRNYTGSPLMQVDQRGIFKLSLTLAFKGDSAAYNAASLRAPLVRLRSYMSLRRDKANYSSASLNNMLAFSDLSFFAKAYYPCKALDSHAIRCKREGSEFPKKLVLISSSNADGVNPNYASMSDLSVVAHLGGEGMLKSRLALLRLGGSPENWVWDTDFCTRVFVNIATYKGKLCTLNHCGRVFVMDYDSLKFTLLCVPLCIPPGLEQKSLFEAHGGLYLVDFKPLSKDEAEAYKLCLRPQTWLKVEGMFCESFSAAACFLL